MEKKLNYKDKNYINWSIIQKAVMLDESRSLDYLEIFEIEPINGCINRCKDKEGNIYDIPNYCINDPYFERDLEINTNEQIEEKELKVKIIKMGVSEPLFLMMNNKLSGKELKEQYRIYNSLDKNIKIKMFIYGVEIKDEYYLYQHNITEDKLIYILF